MLKSIFFIALILILSPCVAHAQGTQFEIKGQVFDDKNEALPFANIRMKESKKGMTSDLEGKFSFHTNTLPDTMIISEIGFSLKKIVVNLQNKDNLIIKIQQESFLLGEAVVTGYRDPGKSLMKKVIAKKSENDINQQFDIVSNSYIKTEIDIMNLGLKRSNSLLSEIVKTYNSFNPDSSEYNILPLYFNESYFQEFHGKNLQARAKHKVAEKNLGLPTDQLGVKLDRFDVVLNIYNGVIPILKTSFINPVSNIGLSYYHYEILDTLAYTPHREFIIEFKPKSNNENTFAGTFWIEEDSYALKKLAMKTSAGMNLNFINSLAFEQVFEKEVTLSGKEVWALKNDKQVIDFDSSLELIGIPMKEDTTLKKLRLSKSIVYDNYQIDVKNTNTENFRESFPKLESKIETFDNSMRFDTLSLRENAIYDATTSLLSNKRYKRTTGLINAMASGVLDINNKFRFGPYSSLISANRIEGIRNRVSFWTLEGVSKQWNFNGMIAYGWRDQLLKGGLGVKYVPSTDPYRKTEVFFRRDYDNTTEVTEEIDKDNVFTLASRKNIPNYQVLNQQVKISQELDLNHDISTKLAFELRTLTPTFDFTLPKLGEQFTPNNVSSSSISVSEFSLNLRYAHNERTRIYNYDKFRLYSTYPVLNLFLTQGVKVSSSTPFSYTKLQIGVAQNINIAPKGSFNYNIKAGKVFGTVPYLLMHVPHGNPNYIYSKYAFNNMNPYEFVADRFVSAQLRYSMGGLIFDKIPLIKKLNWRERFIGNFFWGDMSSNNLDYNKQLKSPSIATGKVPYAEVGAGIENIFNLFSIDAVWRLTHLDNTNNLNLNRFGIYGGMKIDF